MSMTTTMMTSVHTWHTLILVVLVLGFFRGFFFIAFITMLVPDAHHGPCPLTGVHRAARRGLLLSTSVTLSSGLRRPSVTALGDHMMCASTSSSMGCNRPGPSDSSNHTSSRRCFFWKAYLPIESTLNGTSANDPDWSIDPEPAQPLSSRRRLALNVKISVGRSMFECSKKVKRAPSP